jgi:cell division protein FtsQ
MDRSLAGRLGIGSIAAPRARPKAGAARARPRRSAPARAKGARRGQPGVVDVAIEHVLRAPAWLARSLHGAWVLLGARRRLRIALLLALLALPLLGGGWLWLRHSSLVAVQHVRVSGVHGSDAAAIDTALTSAAKRMTTLDVSASRLRAAVAAYPVVGEVRVRTSFPHGLRIEVVEQPPVATLTTGGVKTAVAANGVVLGQAHVSGALPALKSAVALTPGERVRDARLLGELAVLGAAPAPLAKATEGAYAGSKGLTLLMRGGLRVYFGDASRPHAKWASLARVLADQGSAGATYVDVRVPERPAAGFPTGTAPPALSAAEAEAGSAGGESSQSLAEGLASAVGGSAGESQGAGSEGSGEGEGEGSSGEGESSASGEGGSESSGEASEGGGGEASG